MKKILLLFVTLFMWTGFVFSQTVLYQDNLDSYTLNSFLAVDNPTWWTTWSGLPGSGEDIQISNTFSHSSPMSGLADVTGGTASDGILKLGNKTSGVYQLKWWMYIDNNKCGYYNIQHSQTPGIEWAFEIYFRTNGAIQLLQSGLTINGTYPKATWFEVKQDINLDKDSIYLYINGTLLSKWIFSHQAASTSGTKQLGGVDFFAGEYAGSGETPAYYIDDIYYAKIQQGTPQHYNYNTAGSANSFPFNIATGKDIQLLYLPGDFNQPTPAPAGNITSVGFRISDSYPLGPWTYTNFTIKMGQSNITSFTSGAFYSPLTTVYSKASVSLSAGAGDWLSITLDTPFPYDPTQSLIVDIGQCAVPGAVGFSACYTTLTDNRRIWSVGGCPFVYSSVNSAVNHFGVNIQLPTAGTLQGVVTNASTGGPVIGARVSVGSTFGYTIANGSYSFQASPSGSQTVTVQKPGFVTDNTIVNILLSGTTIHNVALQVNANPPGPVTAALNSGATAVDINWSPPSGLYEIIYDDGGKENWTVWAAAGNMNAVKFTPITGGASVLAGRVNIGDAANYAAGTDPTLLAPFQIAVYDATGPGGVPGAQIGSPIDVIPASFGWNIFTFPTPISVTGTFYLVMIQGGTPPNAAGLGIDETTNNLRSYSRFVTGSGPWLPASGNYMIRAVVNGQGGPLDIDAMAPKSAITTNPIEGLLYDHTPVSVTGFEGNGDYVPTVIPYTVWRLLEGQEANEPAWGAPIASNIIATSTVDNGWPSLPDGPYRWAVKAGYPVNRLSIPVFSNVIGKNWTVGVTVNVSLTCAVSPVAGTIVKLQNTAFSQYMYTATLTSTGTVTFPAVWKGTYDLTVSKIGYDTYLLPAQLIMTAKTFDVVLLQQKLAPSNMAVDNKSLFATWNAPLGLAYPLLEDWSSGNFTTNNWTSEANWLVTTGFGNPAPSAEFYWSPTLYNYSRSLTSKTMSGTGSPDFKFIYDIYYSDFGGSLEELACRVPGRWRRPMGVDQAL